MPILQTTWQIDFHLRETREAIWSICSQVLISTPAAAPQSSAGSLSSDQLSQIISYLTQNLGITGASLPFDFTAMSATSEDPTPWIFDSDATYHMTFDHSILTHFLQFLIPLVYTLLMVNPLHPPNLVILLPLLTHQIDSPYPLFSAFLNLPFNYYLLAK